MSAKQITPEEHKRQIEAYVKEFPHYKLYAAALHRVFDNACDASVPERMVQARPKSISSFAEKCARKFEKYPDAVNQLTDLCGARIILQTLTQVEALKLFIEKNFKVEERDDKASTLGDDKFGYRDMHYLVRLKPERAKLIGFTAEEITVIGDAIAEVQVRSVSQHAWADTLHDRTYKTPLKLSTEAKRTAALLAAVMEDGDRNFDRLTGEIDGMVANYTAYADRETVEKEIKVQRLIFDNENAPEKKVRIAVQLARLIGPCGKHDEVVALLEPFAGLPGSLRCELLLELGHALCRMHRGTLLSAEYQQGQKLLQEAAELSAGSDFVTVPNLRKQKSLHARAQSRLAWSWEPLPEAAGKARMHYREALRTEPTNPYHLANQLGFEIFCDRSHGMIASMTAAIDQAIASCREHAIAGTEMPYALFTAGRLSLLLGKAAESLGWYARGLRHLTDGKSCVSATAVLNEEEKWIGRLHFGSERIPQEYAWIKRLIALARPLCACGKHETPSPVCEARHVLIIAGGASSMDAKLLMKIKPALKKALQHFRGTVISGGTKKGIPGCVGDIATELKDESAKQFELVGYIPNSLPEDAPKSTGYDRFVKVSADTNFSPGQVLQTWEDLFRDGIFPENVQVLGFGGGPVTAVEYRAAFALGATVAAVENTGGASDEILTDEVWKADPSIMAMPFDEASIQAFTTSATHKHDEKQLDEMAQAFHIHYIKDNPGKLPENMRPWEKLAETYKAANREQARYAVEILRAAGFDVRPTSSAQDAIANLTDEKFKNDVENMARLEHGRWNVERLSNGWRPGRPRDDAKKIHNCIVSWSDLPDDIREYDRSSVRAFPEILTKASLEIFQNSENSSPI